MRSLKFAISNKVDGSILLCMSGTQFFDESTEQSRAKAAIVSKYFDAWARVITRQPRVERIAYLDLFAGPGRYNDGTKSTPIMVLERAICDPALCNKLVAIFNDRDNQNTTTLEQEINSLPGIANLKHAPKVYNMEVGEEIVKAYQAATLVPSLIFVDPWGYKGLSLKLVNAVVKDWACECVFFFNYNRINMGINNESVRTHLDALFGAEIANDLRTIEGALPEQREFAIVEALCRALNPDGRRYILPFAFKNEGGKRTSHHLIFVSKHPLGYTIMKEVMAKESSSSQQGVASFTYNPADSRQPILFEYARPLDELGKRLLLEFAGRSIGVQELFEAHHVGKSFVLKNYKDVVVQLDKAGQITTNRTERHRKLDQCPPDKVQVTFPGVLNG